MQLTRAEILERLKEILMSSDAVPPEICDACNEDSDLFTDIGLSSIGMLYVVIAIEEAFHVRFTGMGVSDFRTVRDVIDHIQEHLS